MEGTNGVVSAILQRVGVCGGWGGGVGGAKKEREGNGYK